MQPDPVGLVTLLSDGPSVYAYVQGNPTGYRDSSGLTAAGALTGARWGGGIAGALGVETGPLDIPIGLLGAGVGAAIGDWWTGPDTWNSEQFWDGLQPCKGRPLRTNGLPGKKRRFYEKDKLHKDHLEGYDGEGQHIGEFDPDTGDQTGPAVPGRSTDVP